MINLSNCCFSPILENSDICSKCKEHCSEAEGEVLTYKKLPCFPQARNIITRLEYWELIKCAVEQWGEK
jgi:hypothetical protein